VLVHAQLAAGDQHPAELAERRRDVGTLHSTQMQTTASNVPSSAGRRSANPSTTSIDTRAAAARSAAAARAAESGSTAATCSTPGG